MRSGYHTTKNEWIDIDNTLCVTLPYLLRLSGVCQMRYRFSKEDHFPEYCKKYIRCIAGHLLTTEKPISPSTEMRGITLFSRNKLVNLPGYFSDTISSHFYDYLTGWLAVDFIDDLDEDVISTDRQKLNWEHPEMKELKMCLQSMLRWLERDWRGKRKKKREEELNKKAQEKIGMTIDEWQKHVPDEVKKHLTPVLENILDDSELQKDEMTGVVEHLQKILPKDMYYHYRRLHPTLSKAVFESYEKEDYYTAVFEGDEEICTGGEEEIWL